jgi:hypothetical protein
MHGYIDIVKFLVENGANIHVNDGHANAPLKYALENKHMDVVEYLREQMNN